VASKSRGIGPSNTGYQPTERGCRDSERNGCRDAYRGLAQLATSGFGICLSDCGSRFRCCDRRPLETSL